MLKWYKSSYKVIVLFSTKAFIKIKLKCGKTFIEGKKTKKRVKIQRISFSKKRVVTYMTKFCILILNTVRVYRYKIYNFVYLVCTDLYFYVGISLCNGLTRVHAVYFSVANSGDSGCFLFILTTNYNQQGFTEPCTTPAIQVEIHAPVDVQ